MPSNLSMKTKVKIAEFDLNLSVKLQFLAKRRLLVIDSGDKRINAHWEPEGSDQIDSLPGR